MTKTFHDELAKNKNGESARKSGEIKKRKKYKKLCCSLKQKYDKIRSFIVLF
jgi:hypothetical protein